MGWTCRTTNDLETLKILFVKVIKMQDQERRYYKNLVYEGYPQSLRKLQTSEVRKVFCTISFQYLAKVLGGYSVIDGFLLED